MTAPVIDRGYAWVVLVASCTLQLFGLGFSIGGIGVMLVSFSKVFPEADVGQISWIGSLRAFQFLASPVAVLLIKRFGCRVVTIVGALLSAAGIALASLSTEVWHAYLSFGVLAGFGVAFTYTSSTAVLGEYFDKRKNIAFPVSCLGNSIGLLVFPYVLQVVLDNAGHNVALYFTAALKAVEIVCGVVFKPNKPIAVSNSAEANRSAAGGGGGGGKGTRNAAATSGKKPGDGALTMVVSDSGNPRYQARVALTDTAHGDGSEAKLAKATLCASPSIDEPEDASAITHRPTGRLQSTLSSESAGSDTPVLDDNDEERRLGCGELGKHAAPETSTQQPVNSFLRMFYLLRDWRCWLLVLHAFSWGFCVVAAEVLAPISMQRRGLSDTDASLGVVVLGAGMLLSSFIMLGVGARKYDRFALYLPMCGLIGVDAILLSVSNLTVAYFVTFGIFGFLFGILISLFLTVLSDFKSAEDYADLFGLYILLNGIGGIAGPAAMGGIQSQVSDSAGWYTIGSVGIVGSILLIPIYVINRRKQQTR